MPRASFHTLGCRLNQADSALMADDLRRHGFDIVPWGQPAELLVVNTCSVTGLASQKSRQAVHAARKRCPKAYIVLAGCDATAQTTGWRESGLVDLILPNPKPPSLAALLPAALAPAESPMIRPGEPLHDDFLVAGTAFGLERTRSNLKIQEGCDYHCTYCLVPSTRGPAHSRDYDDILREAATLVTQSSVREIVLTGVNISTYASRGHNLAGLIASLLALGDHFRIRLGSTEPAPDLLPQLVEMMESESRLCRFLHLPIQYGEDSILRKMGRTHYDCRIFAEQAAAAVKRIPALCLGTDVIVGFPGETDAIFADCRDYLAAVPFGLMHIFPFSPRQGTPAADFPGRPANAVVTARSRQLLQLANDKAEAFAHSQVGHDLPVLIEKTTPAPQGWSDNYLRVSLPASDDIRPNSFVMARITAVGTGRAVTGAPVQ